ncbi:TonB-dependent receptor [bacterium]|nr:TonB-dependent receptor [bacterium]
MPKVRSLSLFVILSCWLLTAISWAGTTGKISGKVTEQDTGDPIPGVNVILEGTTMGAATDLDGQYTILNIPPGQYTLRFRAIGYGEKVYTGLRVSVDLTTRQNAVLSSEAVALDEVTVVAERPVIEMDRTNSAAYVSSADIEQLPVTEVEQLIQLQAGVTVDPGGQLHFRGGRASEVAYLVDGVPVTDRFAGGSTIEVENGVIQELQVISGTFNAEYGQAQSGIINIVSKDPGSQFSANLTGYLSSPLSTQDDMFLGVDEFDPVNEKDVQFTLSGPLPISDKLSFYFFGRANENDGLLFGERRYRPEDAWRVFVFNNWFNLNNPEREFGQAIPYSDFADELGLFTGDGALVPMSKSSKVALNAKIFFRMSATARLFYSGFYDRTRSETYDDVFRFTPDAVPTARKEGFSHTLNLTHTLSPSAFYTGNLSYFGSSTDTYLFNNPFDGRLQTVTPSLQGFRLGGTNNRQEFVNIRTALAKLDLNWQIDQRNLIKLGFEAQKFDVKFKEFSTIAEANTQRLSTVRGTTFEDFFAASTPAVLQVPERTTLIHNEYQHKPLQMAFYVQDKFEVNELIFNAGLRLDYFDSDGQILADPRARFDAQAGQLQTGLLDADAKLEVNPRLGLAFPISDRGVIHASYGHFTQIPDLQFLYTNSEFELSTGDRETIMGNADLKPERTISYEVGLQQELSDDFGIDVTAYAKTIRNLLSMEIIDTVEERVYFRRINADFGSVKGMSVAVRKRYSNYVSGTLDYTLQDARGNASDPNAIFFNNQSSRPVDSGKQEVPLDWDQRHTINLTLTLGDARNLTASFIGKYGSGLPYTPDAPQEAAIETQFANSARKPTSTNLDVHVQKTFKFRGWNSVLFFKVFNVFDTANHLEVYASTGRADRTFRRPAQAVIDAANGLFTLQELDNRPDWFSLPRTFQLGWKIDF